MLKNQFGLCHSRCKTSTVQLYSFPAERPFRTALEILVIGHFIVVKLNIKNTNSIKRTNERTRLNI